MLSRDIGPGWDFGDIETERRTVEIIQVHQVDCQRLGIGVEVTERIDMSWPVVVEHEPESLEGEVGGEPRGCLLMGYMLKGHRL